MIIWNLGKQYCRILQLININHLKIIFLAVKLLIGRSCRQNSGLQKKNIEQLRTVAIRELTQRMCKRILDACMEAYGEYPQRIAVGEAVLRLKMTIRKFINC